MVVFKEAVEFDWDEGNVSKSLLKHNVTRQECEDVFTYQKRRIYEDIEHSQSEERWIILGRTGRGRHLFVVYTQRRDRIRVISARDINKKELKVHYG